MPARSGKRDSDHNTYVHGTNNVICDRTGFKRKATDCSFEWNGLFVWNEVWEERHPQDLIRGFPDDQSPDVSRPDGELVFIDANSVKAEDL
jgi:hypothetical protein